MKVPLLLLSVAVAVLTGCASRVPLQTKPTVYSAASTTRFVDVKVRIADARTDQSLDSVLKNKPSDEVAVALKKALLDSNIASLNADSATILNVEGTLARLDWVVPGYDAIMTKAIATSLLTGGIGAFAYGSTSTPVQGNAVLQLRVLQSGREVLSREYVGFCEEKLAKLKCDTAATKSRVAGAALSDAIEKFLSDLGQPQASAASESASK
ncbi:MAG TPA: hypothetical protein VEH04_09335 [Verrucomicrobiae bacterium]|nr:hypothetical protein [Verrucomicrobiae bacterium]